MKNVFCLLIFILSFTMSYSQVEVKEPSHYLFPEFSKGVVLLKTGIKNEALANYNLLAEEMIFENNDKKSAIKNTELELVDTIFIKDKKFVTLNNKIIELIYHSKYELYAEHKCRVNDQGKPDGYGGVSNTSSSNTYSAWETGGTFYEQKLPNGYKVKPFTNYWLKKNEKVTKFTNMKQLMKLYDDKKDLFKEYVKKNDVNCSNQGSIIELISYLETN